MAQQASLIDVGPKDAKEWIELFAYKHQRPVRPDRLKRYVAAMKGCQWRPGSMIHIVKIKGGGGQFLVNGRHRLQAVIDSNTHQKFTLLETSGVDPSYVDEQYAVEDDNAIRNPSESIVPFHEKLYAEIGTGRFKRLATALRYIDGGFRYATSMPALVLSDMMTEWTPFAKAYYALIDISSTMVWRVERGPVQAIALTTVRYQEKKAGVFWCAVASGDNIVTGDPAKTLREYILANVIRGDNTSKSEDAISRAEMAFATAKAWNAYATKRPLRLIKRPTDAERAKVIELEGCDE